MDEYSSSSSSGGILPLLLGAVGLLFGLAGIIFGMQAKSMASDTDSALAQLASGQTESGSVETRVKQIESQLAAINSSNVALTEQIDILNKGLRQLSEDTSQYLNQFQKAINENRRHLGLANGSPSQQSSGAPATEGSYTIQSGDNLWSIARRVGLSVDAIQAANPDIDPSRLRVGQQINIPQ